ncbi:hypothetical protein BDY21DRAFT_352318 [Lineolata rhizophorae]|uniref:protein-histidine N-methyltransferase n=1 Tax=Lineolata rhizophorae TaxID=578093 RepID=A0A6A6NSE4_9PEZI|nr:hypothetical protein BDY21DRAFT_352318 [Lineolata rhizophorae]
MAGQFRFGFSGDEMGEADVDAGESHAGSGTGQMSSLEQAQSVPAQAHNVAEWLSSFPSRISYSTIKIESPKGRCLDVPRRELFDVKMQLLAEDEGNDADLLAGLDSADIKTNVYEGGFKSWECSIDLAALLLDRGPRKDIDDLCRVDHVVELGCGTAIPTLILYQYALSEGLSLYFTLADYNVAVLRLVTLPNLLLMWAKSLKSSTASPFSSENPNPLHESPTGDLEITPQICASFLESLREQNLILNLVSGSWTPPTAFLPLIPVSQDMNTLVLASETIYSPSSLSAFTEVLVGILERVRMGKAMVAAKRVYFGVGGSVSAFKQEAAGRKAVAYEIENADIIGRNGVQRCLMEVQMM